MQVVVFGASGMLGSMVTDVLSRDPELAVSGTARGALDVDKLQARLPRAHWHVLDAEQCSLSDLGEVLRGARWAINAIGVIKPHIHDDNPMEVERAVRVNALFPHRLARAAEQTGCQVLQIATDCVYSGSQGHYVENDPHDALDVYGKTKSLGEVCSPHVHHLRCSIIGPEPKAHVSLLDWFLAQPHEGAVNGYTNHQWNGVTTLHFARLCHGIVTHAAPLSHIQHIVPTGAVSKAELLQCFAREYRREDITIHPAEARTVIDRTLGTTDGSLNQRLWTSAGYPRSLSVPQMVAEMAQFDYRLGGD